MKYLKFSPIIIVLAFLLYYSSPSDQLSEQSADAEQKQWESKTDDRPPVTVKVTPVEFGQDAQTWKFRIVLDTHSGSLDDNLLRVAVLTDDKGKVYEPVAWEGAEPGGHHREGVLMFNAVQPMPESIEIKIKNVGGVPERSFAWSLK